MLIAPGNFTYGSLINHERLVVSIRPGAHRTGERQIAYPEIYPLIQFQSAPVLIAPGNVAGAYIDTLGAAQFQSAPVLIAPGNGELVTALTPIVRFQSAPVLIAPGNNEARRRSAAGRMFQSAPVLIAPGN